LAALLVAALRASVVTGSQITFFGTAGIPVILPTMLGVLALYAQLLVAPILLCPFYDWFIVPPSSKVTVDVVLGAMLVVGIALTTWKLRRRLPGVALGLAWLALGLVPVLHFVPLLNVAAERFLYLPSAGFALALAGALTWAHPKVPRAALAIGVLIITLFAVRTLWRWPDWRDDRSLNQATAGSFPETPAPLINLAEMEAAAGNRAAAASLLEQAEKRAPGWPAMRAIRARILSVGAR
jgi:protein O-mannosyl-transferase